MNERHNKSDELLSEQLQQVEASDALADIKSKINAAVQSGYHIGETSELKGLVEKPADERNSKEKIAYQMLIDFLKLISEAQVQQISNVLFGSEKSNFLFNHVHDTLKVEIKNAYLKIKKADDNHQMLDQKHLLDELEKSYHVDYFLGMDPMEFMVYEIVGHADQLKKASEKMTQEQEKELEECLKNLKSKVFLEMINLLNRNVIRLSISVAEMDARSKGPAVFTAHEQVELARVFRNSPTGHYDTELRAFIQVAESLGIICMPKNFAALDNETLPSFYSERDNASGSSLEFIPIALPAHEMPAPISENSTNLEKVQHVQDTIKAVKNQLKQEKSSKNHFNTFLSFAGKALLAIFLTLTVVGMASAIESKLLYGTYKFWSAKRVAKGMLSKVVSDSHFKEDTGKILGRTQKKK